MSKYLGMGRLSEAERDAVAKSGNQKMIKYMKIGDDAENSGNLIDEALYHRRVQELLTKQGIKMRDNESMWAYGYNSAIIHHMPEVKERLAIGNSFEDMFSISNKPFTYSYKENGFQIKRIDQYPTNYNNSIIGLYGRHYMGSRNNPMVSNGICMNCGLRYCCTCPYCTGDYLYGK